MPLRGHDLRGQAPGTILNAASTQERPDDPGRLRNVDRDDELNFGRDPPARTPASGRLGVEVSVNVARALEKRPAALDGGQPTTYL